MIVKNELPALLQSICAQLRHPGNAVGHLGEQAAGAIESLWRDNVALTNGVLEIEGTINRTMDMSCAINRFRQIRQASAPVEQQGKDGG